MNKVPESKVVTGTSMDRNIDRSYVLQRKAPSAANHEKTTDITLIFKKNNYSSSLYMIFNFSI